MRTLETGADGFIGSHLVELLLSQGDSVKGLSVYNSFNNWGWLEDIAPNENLEIFSGDIRDPFYCEEITKDVDVIFHLAALIAIPYSYLSPDSYVETNIAGTLNICQAALKNKVNRLVHTSTVRFMVRHNMSQLMKIILCNLNLLIAHLRLELMLWH